MGFLAALLPFLGKALDSVLPRIAEDKDKANEIKSAIIQELMKSETELDAKAADIVLAEAKGQSWLQRNWRPLLMVSIVAIIVNNYIVAPYLSLFGLQHLTLNLPQDLYDLMKIGVGGYVVGRSAEKVTDLWKNGGGNSQ